MSDQKPANQPQADLSYLYDFICECPNPRISEALKKLVDHWLKSPKSVPDFSATLKKRLETTDDELVEICWLLSINPKTPPSVLQDLCAGASSELLERIAENSNSGVSTLAQLSYQAVAEIRIATASNSSTPLASIMLLVQDDNPDVRFSVAENSNVPKEALEALTNDENPYVRLRATVTATRAEIARNVFENSKQQGEQD